MKTIYKYPIEVTDRVSVQTHKNAQLLTCQDQYGQLCLWFEVDTEQPLEERVFNIYGTGNPITVSDQVFVGTAQHLGGRLVWHVYEQIPLA